MTCEECEECEYERDVRLREIISESSKLLFALNKKEYLDKINKTLKYLVMDYCDNKLLTEYSLDKKINVLDSFIRERIDLLVTEKMIDKHINQSVVANVAARRSEADYDALSDRLDLLEKRDYKRHIEELVSQI